VTELVLNVPDGTVEERLRYIQAVREKCRREHNARGAAAKGDPEKMAEFRAWQKMVQDAAVLSDEELAGIDPEAVFTTRVGYWPT